MNSETNYKTNTNPADPLKDHKVLLKQPGAVHVQVCGHRFDARNQPRHQCEYCWNVYWYLHPAEVEASRSALKVYGKENIIKKRGTTYFKWVKKAIQELEARELAEAQAQSLRQMATPTTDTMESNSNQLSDTQQRTSETVKSEESFVSSTT